jgi:hypothetical protein
VSESVGKHVFVSYVREDSAQVDQLCAILEASRIPYWRDRTSLGPGDAWKAKIRDAIREGSLVFLACFSEFSRAKLKSHMNEELTLAVEEYRKMPPGRTWLIPVRFDDGDVPEWDLGAGRVLSDLNYVDLFGSAMAPQAASLVTTIHGVMGEKQLGAAQTLEAVEHAVAADRIEVLKRLTKEMLLDPQRRIQLDDLVGQEVQRVILAISDSVRVVGPLEGSGADQIVHVAESAQELWSLAAPFCASLQVAARWASPDALAPWTMSMKSFVEAANRSTAGVTALIEQRRLPGMVAAMTAGLACVANAKWENLRVLLTEQMVKDPYQPTRLPLLEATDPYAPFGSAELVPHALAHSAVDGLGLRDALEDFTERRKGKYHTPVAEWLHHVLRPLFIDQLPQQDAYDAEFDRAEVMLGLLSTDLVLARRPIGTTDRMWGGSRWFGRSMWRSKHSYGNPIDDFSQELATQEEMWAPLRAGLFGGSQDRAQAAIDKYRADFSEWSRSIW